MNHPGSPFWVPSAALQRHLNRTATGDPENDWLSHVRAKHLPAALARTLVIGCGEGFIERALLRREGVAAITAVDTNVSAVERARRHADRVGMSAITYGTLDLDTGALPRGPWDAVIVHDLLHHVEKPEAVFAAIHDALAPTGRLTFVEYVGPNRFQYSDEHMELVRRYFRLLPDRLRKDPGSGRILWRRERIDPERLARTDPFEAAASADILPLARRMFTAEAEYSGGGGLLHPLLSGLASNFGQALAEEERLLRVLCDAEAHLSRSGLLADDFAIFVGRRGNAGSE